MGFDLIFVTPTVPFSGNVGMNQGCRLRTTTFGTDIGIISRLGENSLSWSRVGDEAIFFRSVGLIIRRPNNLISAALVLERFHLPIVIVDTRSIVLPVVINREGFTKLAVRHQDEALGIILLGKNDFTLLRAPRVSGVRGILRVRGVLRIRGVRRLRGGC